MTCYDEKSIARAMALDFLEIRRMERLPYFANIRDGELVDHEEWEMPFRWSWIVAGAAIWVPIIWALT